MYASQPSMAQDDMLPKKSATESRHCFLGHESAKSLGLEHLSAQDYQLVLRVAEQLFLCPTKPSREIATELGLERNQLLRLYQIIKNNHKIQELFTHESPQRRRVSFLRRELLPANLPFLEPMFRGEICLPNHVEFHLALMCNLRCRACPNCQTDSNGEWNFLGYPNLGQPLTAERLHLIQDMFLEMGVTSFSFGGGGEPSLSPLLTPGISYLREQNPKAEISLYTNGIFPTSWTDAEFTALVTHLNKVRFSIDAADAQSWSRYKGRPPEFFDALWKNIERLVETRKQVGGRTRIGASCLVSTLSYRNLETFLQRAQEAGLDFCDIKEVETCFGEKSEVKVDTPDFREFLDDLISRVRKGFFAPLDVVIDDRLVLSDAQGRQCETENDAPPRCWVSIRGRMLTVGPYGELHPCSDAANPGSQVRKTLSNSIGQLTAFDNPDTLHSQFLSLWSASLPWRTSLSRTNCAYCVPSHMNFNLAVQKLFEDWEFGIMPENQPFAGERDHYLASRGSQR